ncbi:MAG: hypothetical protein OEP95_00685 [Myxococcales bacterium]|nr:hypothetical protein [Myxococcales bacterium]
MRTLRLLALGLLAAATTAAAPSLALDRCKARIDTDDGTVQVSAKDVSGELRWGISPDRELRNFWDETSCVDGDRAKRCTLDAPDTLERITPPASCRIHLADANDACTAWVRGCTPGVRERLVPVPPPSYAARLVQDSPDSFEVLLDQDEVTLPWTPVFDAHALHGSAAPEFLVVPQAGYWYAHVSAQSTGLASGILTLSVVTLDPQSELEENHLVASHRGPFPDDRRQGGVLLRLDENQLVSARVRLLSNQELTRIYNSTFSLHWVGPLERERAAAR